MSGAPANPGASKPGYCKICAHPEAARFIKGAREGGRSGKGWNAAEAQVHGETYGLEFNRQTWYAHQKHSQTTEMRVIQTARAVQEAGGGGLTIKRSSNLELLEAIRDIGTAKALRSPDEVTIDHALKAVQIMEGKKDKGSDSLNILVSFVTGNAPAVIVEGTARDVTQEASS